MRNNESNNDKMGDDELFTSLFIPGIIPNTSEDTLYEPSSMIESISSNRNSRDMDVRDCLTSEVAQEQGSSEAARLHGHLSIQMETGIEYRFTIDVQSSTSRVLKANRHRKRIPKQEKMFLLKTYSLLQPKGACEVSGIISQLYRGENREIFDYLQTKDRNWRLPSTPFYTTKSDIYQFIYNNCIRNSKKNLKKQ